MADVIDAEKVLLDLDVAESIVDKLLLVHKILKPITKIQDRHELNRDIVKLKVAINRAKGLKS